MVKRPQIVERIANEFNLTKEFSAQIVDFYEQTIMDALVSGEDVRLTDFLIFKIELTGGTHRYSCVAKSKIFVPLKYKLKIKPGGKLKRAIESQKVSRYEQQKHKEKMQEVDSYGES